VQDHPTTRELLEAVTHFLSTEVAPTMNDPRMKFRALVAATVLHIVMRELEMGDELVTAEWHRLDALMGDDAPGENLTDEVAVMTGALCARIRQGQADEGTFHDAVLAHVEQTVVEKLRVANPKYLERVKNEPR
jgi:Domain of unknown function (DUF6285)